MKTEGGAVQYSTVQQRKWEALKLIKSSKYKRCYESKFSLKMVKIDKSGHCGQVFMTL